MATSELWGSPAVVCPVVVPHERATVATTTRMRTTGHRRVVKRVDVTNSSTTHHPDLSMVLRRFVILAGRLKGLGELTLVSGRRLP